MNECTNTVRKRVNNNGCVGFVMELINSLGCFYVNYKSRLFFNSIYRLINVSDLNLH